jgi:hypothetical protein
MHLQGLLNPETLARSSVSGLLSGTLEQRLGALQDEQVEFEPMHMRYSFMDDSQLVLVQGPQRLTTVKRCEGEPEQRRGERGILHREAGEAVGSQVEQPLVRSLTDALPSTVSLELLEPSQSECQDLVVLRQHARDH